jgi:uncharacterized protein (TIGR00725 family)
VPGRAAPYIAVCGPHEATAAELVLAEEVGAGIAAAGAVLVSGGGSGVMEASCRGARSKRGMTLGLLPGDDRRAANGWVEIPVATGMGEMRNALIVRASDAVIAIGGAYGTLSEVALALRAGRPVVGLATWEVPGVVCAADADSAVAAALRAIA